MRNTKIVDRVLLVIEGSTCEQQGGGQDSDQDQGGEESALGLGLHPGPGSSLVRRSVGGGSSPAHDRHEAVDDDADVEETPDPGAHDKHGEALVEAEA